MLNFGQLVNTVQQNCHISDALYAGEYTVCIFLLKMREFYRWENDIPYSGVLPKNAIGEWLHEGFTPVRGQRLSAAEQAQPASLLQPEGIYGPAFLATKNYFVIKEYNFSDL